MGKFDVKKLDKGSIAIIRTEKMTTENPLSILNSSLPDLQVIKDNVYDKCGFDFNNLTIHEESKEYAACSFRLNKKTVEHRMAKITPTKTGQFVTIWKRNADGITAPFDATDAIDYLIITTRNGNNLGQFIFPKSVLIEKGIFSQKGKEGKRGIRVYPPWDNPTNAQGAKTQQWQIQYFLKIPANFDLIKQLLNLE